MPKISTKTSGLNSQAEFTAAVDECAEIEVELRAATAALDKELQIIRERHNPNITALTARRDALLAKTCQYAATHQETVLTAGTRSGSTAKACYGFRLGKPTLVLLNNDSTWEKVVAAIKAKGRAFAKLYISTPAPKPNKDAMKAKLSEAELAKLGCRIEQTDSFYLEPKDDNMEAVSSIASK